MSTDTIFDKPPVHGHTEAAPSLTKEGLDAFRSVLRSRRSVRVYEKTPIPEAVVQECLDLALLAPNSSNLQPWEFYRVSSPEKRAEIVAACFSQPAAATAAELFICVGRTSAWRQTRLQMLEHFAAAEMRGAKIPAAAKSYYEKLVPMFYTQGPLSILGTVRRIATFFIGFTRPVPREPMSHKEMGTWAIKSCALACENLMLAFRAHGYDTCPMEGLDSARVRRILGLPRDAVVVMGISACKRAPNGVYGPQVRFNRDQFLKTV